MSEPKRKLRTAADVISRLKWDSNSLDVTNREHDWVFGYSDRIHGPMEKCLQDYVPASQGGDIPEHRINYFRKGRDVLWDRRTRLDKIFVSSGDETAHVSSETFVDMQLASATAARLTEERQIRLEERIKRSHNRQRKVKLNDYKVGVTPDRHVWAVSGASFGDNKTSQPVDCFRILTWNVLFDLFDTEPADERWRLSMKRIGEELADIILLQEVTPQYACALLACDWFVDNYHASATLDNLSSVEPFGNVILWKPNLFELASHNTGVFTCFDGHRNRAVLCVLRNDRHVFIVANVHLPADHAMVMMSEDQNNVIAPKERRIARQRERAAIIAKSQILQELYESKGCSVTCIMGGDFNIVEGVEVLDGKFSMFFRDAWTECSADRGDTFDPEHNTRAVSNKGPRRIDRIFVGDTLREYTTGQGFPTTSEAGSLIGTLRDVHADRCPSDHYGVLIDCKINQANSPSSMTSLKAWSCCSHASSDSLLALCFDYHEVYHDLCDGESSLPVPHLTMLHGFVELNNDESRYLALRSIEEAISQSLDGRSFPLFFDETSLTVFEHRASASVVYLPTKVSEANVWLKALYSTLRAVFPQCSDQEARFESGWCAHLTLGTYPTVELARAAVQLHFFAGKKVQLDAHSLGLFQRNQMDRRFYMVSAVSLVQPRHGNPVINPAIGSLASFVEDAGTSAWMHFKSLADNAAVEVQRACQWVLDKHWSGLSAHALPYGSYLLSSSVPGISDVDLIVTISSTSQTNGLRNFDQLRFFQNLKARLEDVYIKANVRLRLAGAPGDAHFYLLTTKLAPELPSVDVMLHFSDDPDDVTSTKTRGSDPEQSIDDSLCILRMLDRSSLAFSQALRLVKIWAFRRHIYGSAVGFIGGGGWAVLLAYHIMSYHGTGLDEKSEDVTPRSIAASFFLLLPKLLMKNPAEIDLKDFMTEEPDSRLNDQSCDKAPLRIWAPVIRKNHARNSTHGTIATMISEAERARLLVVEGDATSVSLFETISTPFALSELGGSLILEIVLHREDRDETLKSVSPNELKAWLCRQALSTMVSLEREYGFVGGNVRPLSRPRKVGKTFLHSLSVSTPISGSFIARRKVAMQEELRATFQTSFLTSELVDVVVYEAR